MPSENMSLKMLQLEFIWFSGAAKANTTFYCGYHNVAHKLGRGVAMASNCVAFCGGAQIDTLSGDSQRDIAR